MAAWLAVEEGGRAGCCSATLQVKWDSDSEPEADQSENGPKTYSAGSSESESLAASRR